MFGTKTSLVLLLLAVLCADLKAETQDSCDFGVPAMEDFDRRKIRGVYINKLTNSKKLANSFCSWEESFVPSKLYVTIQDESLPPEEASMEPISSAQKRKGSPTLDVNYYGTSDNTKVNDLIHSLSGSYSFLGTDYKDFIVMGACLDQYEKPLIRAFAQHTVDVSKLRKFIQGLGLDETQFTPFDGPDCIQRILHRQPRTWK